MGKLLIKVAYPDTWEDYSDVAIRPDDLIGNIQRLSERAYRHRLARLDAPIDRRRWLDAPQSTSAYYNRSASELAIPAGILQAPWYDVRASAADNYGGIGTVIAMKWGTPSTIKVRDTLATAMSGSRGRRPIMLGSNRGSTGWRISMMPTTAPWQAGGRPSHR